MNENVGFMSWIAQKANSQEKREQKKANRSPKVMRVLNATRYL